MSSNKRQQQMPSLYLKEFFGRYFERKQMLETISNFSSGLKVLEVIIQNFERARGIRHLPKIQVHSHSTADFRTDIDREGRNISQTLENIYDRLQNIFEHWPSTHEEPADYSLKSSRKCLEVNGDDDELYEMLNKYKNDFKREKADRITAEKEIKQLRVQIDSLNEEKRILIDEKLKSSNIATSLKQALADLQSENSLLKQQIEECSVRIQELTEAQAAYQELKADHQVLSLKHAQSEQKEKLLKQKFKAIDGIIEAKINARQKQWEEMITQQLKSADIYKNPTCKVFRDFVKAINKENLHPQSSS